MKALKRWAAPFNYCLISLFIVVYFCCSATWLWITAPEELRPNSPVTSLIRSSLAPFICLAGLDQSWAFFSPNINNENSYTLLVITLQNGLLKLIELPRMDKLTLWEKMQQEKYRKLFGDNMTKPGFSFMRPDIARCVSRTNAEPDNKPKRIAFFLISTPIPPPKPAQAAKSIANTYYHTPVEKYFVYGTSPDDF